RTQDMKRYICANCGYVYDPQAGDPMSGIPPGTAFDDLPEAWVCPMCYAAKSQFDELD
ncbi:MAG: rubredoxin, partial [Actinobacteria bacterium]|nr:rubredoxin [Actinomycetota bacterium]